MNKYKAWLYVTGVIELLLGVFLLVSSIYTMAVTASIPVIMEDLTEHTSANAEALAILTQRIYLFSAVLSLLVSITFLMLGLFTMFDTKRAQNTLQTNRIFGTSIFEYIMAVVYVISAVNYMDAPTFLFALFCGVAGIIKTCVLQMYKKQQPTKPQIVEPSETNHI